MSWIYSLLPIVVVFNSVELARVLNIDIESNFTIIDFLTLVYFGFALFLMFKKDPPSHKAINTE